MRKQPKVLLIASALVASLAAAPALFAHDSGDHGMMEHCGQMMGDDSRQPNDQWRKAPSAPSEKR
ncbi:MAG: hypothetical protein K2Y27_18575 [Xanthobacteraceae bacterium]|nr:hypothetical protein [Xanthobacteraceae bacterium]